MLKCILHAKLTENSLPRLSGDVLASIETDKAEIELESFGAGVLRKILVCRHGMLNLN